MKKLLLVLLVLAAAVPAGAEVFVYDQKSNGSGNDCNNGVWGTFKGVETAYTIIDVDFADTNKIDIWQVNTWKEQKVKKADIEHVGEVNFVVAPLTDGKKTKWIISDKDPNGRFVFMGDVKPVTIGAYNNASCNSCHDPSKGSLKTNAAPSMAGSALWDQTTETLTGTHRAIGTAAVSMKLNTKFTLEAHRNELFNAEDAAYGLLSALQDYYDYNP
jgi:hypothetical protein